MTDFRPGGRRRLDRVLAPDRLTSLPDTDADALRQFQRDAEQEEAELSYVRRLLQGRLDQVRDEQGRRSVEPASPRPSGRSDDQLVEMLSTILAERRTDRGSGRYVAAEADHDAQRRRAAEVAVADVRLSDPSQLDDADLAAAHTRLADLENRVSFVRQALQVVTDAVTAELSRREEGEPSPRG